MNAIEEKIYQLAKPYLNFRNNDVHTQIALNQALELLERVGGDRHIVVPAILLHDVGWTKVPKEQFEQWRSNPSDKDLDRIHEQEGVKIASSILQDVNYDSTLAEEILRIINVHDTGEDAKSLNEKIVRDADVLWRFSNNGFWTTLEMFEVTPQERIERLESMLEEWLFMSVSKEIATKQLAERKREVEAL